MKGKLIGVLGLGLILTTGCNLKGLKSLANKLGYEGKVVKEFSWGEKRAYLFDRNKDGNVDLIVGQKFDSSGCVIVQGALVDEDFDGYADFLVVDKNLDLKEDSRFYKPEKDPKEDYGIEDLLNKWLN